MIELPTFPHLSAATLLMHDFWSHCIAHFERTLNAQQLNTWIKPLLVEVNQDQILISAPNRFVAQWVREKFLHDIEQLSRDFFTSQPKIELLISETRAQAATQQPITQSDQADQASPAALLKRNQAVPLPELEVIKPREVRNNTTKNEKPTPLDESRLNPLFNFDSFVPGKANDLARAAALQVADNPGAGYNPLFVYGGVGLGKTHLVQAIGNHMLQLDPKARIRYIHADRYVSDVVRAVRTNSYDDFKRRYDTLDLLLIDDIQFFSGKEGTQQQFFYTFNTLIEEHKQVIITSDTFPSWNHQNWRCELPFC